MESDAGPRKYGREDGTEGRKFAEETEMKV